MNLVVLFMLIMSPSFCLAQLPSSAYDNFIKEHNCVRGIYGPSIDIKYDVATENVARNFDFENPNGCTIAHYSSYRTTAPGTWTVPAKTCGSNDNTCVTHGSFIAEGENVWAGPTDLRQGVESAYKEALDGAIDSWLKEEETYKDAEKLMKKDDNNNPIFECRFNEERCPNGISVNREKENFTQMIWGNSIYVG